MRGSLLLCAALLACDDPSIEVEVSIPEPYRAQVVALAMDVILPPPGQPFGCEDIAFGAVSDAEVDTATQQKVNAVAGEHVGFLGVPRVGDKLFRVRGLDADGEAVVAACEAHGVIDGDVLLELVGEPTSSALIGDFETGRLLPTTMTVGVRDINDEPIAGVDVRYTVTGPGVDAVTTDTAVSDAMGRATLAPLAPALPGPVALDIRPRWVRSLPASLLAWGPMTVVLDANLPGGTDGDVPSSTQARYAIGRIGPAGELGVAALGPSDSPFTTGRQVYLAYYDPSQSPPFRNAVSAPIANALALGVVDTGARDQLFTITGNAWLEILPTGATVSSPSPRPGRAASFMLPAGDCAGSAASGEVLVVWSDESVATYGPGGAPATSPFDDEPSTSRPLASGCVSATDDATYRAVVYAEGNFQQRVVAEMDVVRRAGAPVLAAGIGFSRAVGDAGRYLLGTQVTIEGTELTRFRLRALGESNLELEEVARDPTTTVAQATGGGDFDGDGELDVAALLGFGDGERGTAYRTFFALEVDHLGDRLVGLSPLAQAVRPHMWILDIDGDGVDEIVVGGQSSLRIERAEPR